MSTSEEKLSQLPKISYEKERALRNTTVKKIQERTEAPTTLKEDIGDIVNAATGFVTSALQFSYGIANTLSQSGVTSGHLSEQEKQVFGIDDKVSLEDVTGIGAKINDARKYLNDSLGSDKLKRQQAFITEQANRFKTTKEDIRKGLERQGLTPEEVEYNLQIAEMYDPYLFSESKETQSQEYQDLGFNEGISNLLAEAANVGTVIGNRLDNPRALATETVEAAGTLAVSGGVAALTRKGFEAAVKDKLKDPKKVERFLKSKAGRDAINQVQGRTALTTIATGEGSSTAMDVHQSILGTSFEDLEKTSPKYRNYVKDSTPEEARKRLADESYKTSFLLQASAAGLISNVTGTDKLVGKLFDPTSKLGQKLSSSFVAVPLAGLKEGTEESLQGATGNTVTNLTKAIALGDSEVDLTDNFGETIGSGAISGTLSGATLTGLAKAPQTFREVRSTTAKVVGAAGKIKEALSDTEVTTKVAQGKTEELLDTTSSSYNASDALNALFVEANKPKEHNELLEYEDTLVTHLSLLQEEAIEVAELMASEQKKSGQPSRKTKQKYRQLLNLGQKTVKEVNRIRQITSEESKTKVSENAKSEDEAVTKKAYGTAMTRLAQYSVPELKELRENNNFTEEQNKVLDDVISLRGAATVRQQILQGDAKNIGILGHIQRISSSLQNGSNDTALKLLGRFKKFVVHQNSRLTSLKNIQAALGKGEDVSELIQEHSNKFPSLSGKPLDVSDETQFANLIQFVDEDTQALNTGYATARSMYRSMLDGASETARQEETQTNPPSEAVEPEVTLEPATGSDATPTNTNTSTGPVEGSQPTTKKHSKVKPGKKIKPPVEVEAENAKRKEALNRKRIEAKVKYSLVDLLDLTTKKNTKSLKTITEKLYASNLTDEALDEALEGISSFIQGNSSKTGNNLYSFGLEVAKNSGLSNEFSLGRSITLKRKNSDMVRKTIRVSTPKTPIQKQPNFIETVSNEVEKQKEYNLTDNEVKALQELTPFISGFTQTFDSLIRNIPKKYVKKTNAYNALFDAEGVPLSESNPDVMVALALHTLEYVNANLGSPSRSYDEIAAALGYENYYLPRGTFSTFKHRGVLKTNVTRTLGRSALKTLGLTITDGTVQNSYELGLGTILANTLVKMNLLELNSMPSSEYVEYKRIKPEYPSSKKAITYFYAPKKTQDSEGNVVLAKGLETAIAPLKENIRLTQKVLGSTNLKFPSEVGPDTSKTKLKDSFSAVGKKIKRIRDKHGKRPVKLKSEMSFLDGMREGFVEEIFGYTHNLKGVHITKRDYLDDVNNGIKRTIHNVKTFKDTLSSPDASFYLTSEVWRNMRMGIADSALNPNNNKIVRHLITLESAIVTLDVNNGKDMDNFYLALAEPLDIKVDKLRPRIAIEAVKEQMATDVFQNAVKAISEMQEGIYTTKNQRDLVTAVNHYGDTGFTLDALVAASAYLNRPDDKNTFETSLFREVDGITNGVIIGTLLFASGRIYDLLRKGGIFTEYTTYAELLEQGELDLYQDLAHSVSTGLTVPPYISSLVGEITDAMGKVTSLGRTLFKDPLMVTVYGASLAGVMDNFTNTVLDNLYDRIEKAAKEKNQKELDNITSELVNTLKHMKLKRKLTVSNALNTSLEDMFDTKELNVESVFKAYIADYYKEAIDKAIDDMFGEFIANRNKLNQAVSVVFEGFSAIHDVELLKAEKSNRGPLTREQYDTFMEGMLKYAPMVAHAHTEGATDKLLLAKPSREPDYTKLKRVEVVSNQPISVNRYVDNNLTKGNITTIYSHPVRYSWEDNGLGSTISLIHAFDAATMYSTLDQEEVLNVFDAIGIPLNRVEAATATINKALFELAQKYSPMRETTVMLMNSGANILKYVQKNPEVANKIRKNTMQKHLSNKEQLRYANAPLNVLYKNMAKELRSTARRIDGRKNQYLSQVVQVSQYNNNVNGYTPEIEADLEDSIVDWLTDRNNYASGVGITEEGKKDDFYRENKETIDKFISRVFGSSNSGASIDPNKFGASFTSTVNPDEVVMHFDRLLNQGKVSVSNTHSTHLKKVLSVLVQKVVKPFNYAERVEGDENAGLLYGEDVYLNVAQHQPASVLAMSAAEGYTHELAHLAIKFGLDNMSTATREIKRMFSAANSVVTVEDFLPAGITPNSPNYAREYSLAEETYNYIFRNTARNPDGTNNYLHEFAVYGLTNEKFMQILDSQKVTDAYHKRNKLPDTSKLDVATRIVVWFQNILDRINEIILFSNKNKNSSASKQLFILAQRIAKQQQRYNNIASVTGKYQSVVDRYAVGALQQFVVAPILRVVRSNAVLNSKYAPVRAIGKSIITLHSADMTTFNRVLRQVTKRFGLARDNIITTVATEINVSGESNIAWEDEVRKTKRDVDTLSQKTANAVADYIGSAFYTELSDEEQIALTELLLRSDASVLLNEDNSNEAEVIEFITNDSKRLKRIDALTDQLMNNKYGHYYVNQVKNLAHFMVTERSLYRHLQLNATQIVNLSGTSAIPEGNSKQLIKIVDELVTLLALQGNSDQTKSTAIGAINREVTSNPELNGISVLLRLHKSFKEESMGRLFNNKPHLMEKGYISEITDPNVDFIVAPKSEEARLAKENYVLQTNVRNDSNSTLETRDLGFYINPYGGLARWNSGAASLTSRRSKGVSIYQYFSNLGELDAVASAQNEVDTIRQNNREDIKALFTDKPVKVGEKATALIPVMNEVGTIADYRYVMDKDTRDTVLKRNLRVLDVFGSMQASIAAKENTVNRNREVVKLIHEEYTNASTAEIDEFVYIGAKATGKEKELYDLMPNEMKADMQDFFGEDGMYINEHMLHIILGFRQVSMFNKPEAVGPELRGIVNKTTLGYVTEVFKKMVGTGRAQAGDQFWLELVALSKNNIVIRFVDTLLGNIASNFVLLKALGVGNRELAKEFTLGIAAAKAYTKVERDLARVRLDIKAKGSTPARRSEVARLENELKTNPVYDLVDAGLYTTIVDDVTMLDDRYAYENSIEKVLKPISSRTPVGIKNLFDVLYMRNNTAPYKFLNDVTKLSDFVARYTLHMHNMRQGMTKKKSLQQISQVFINYDVNSGRYVDAMNRYGLVLFTKFFFRIQQVILTLWKKKPASQLAVFMLEDLILGEVSDINDSLMLINSGVNFQLNPLELLDPVFEIPLAEAILN